MVRAPGAADLERRARHVEDLLRLARVQVPDDHGVAEALHRLRIGHQLAEVHHVVVPARERRGDEHVAARQGANVVAVAVGEVAALFRAAQRVVGRHPVRRDVLAVVRVLDHGRAPAVVLVVRQAGDHHAPGKRVEGVRADDAAAVGDEGVDRLVQRRLGGIAVDVEDEDLAGVESGGPQIAAVVGEPGVVRLVASADGKGVDHLAVLRRFRVGVDRHQLVLLVADTLHAQGPDVDEVFLADDLGHVRRHAGFVGSRRAGGERQSERGEDNTPTWAGSHAGPPSTHGRRDGRAP